MPEMKHRWRAGRRAVGKSTRLAWLFGTRVAKWNGRLGGHWQVLRGVVGGQRVFEWRLVAGAQRDNSGLAHDRARGALMVAAQHLDMGRQPAVVERHCSRPIGAA